MQQINRMKKINWIRNAHGRTMILWLIIITNSCQILQISLHMSTNPLFVQNLKKYGIRRNHENFAKINKLLD